MKRKTHKKQSNPKFRISLKLDNLNWEKTEKFFFKERQKLVKHLDKAEKCTPSTKDILNLLAGGAVIGLSFLIPAAPMALAPLLIDSRKYNTSLFNQTIKRLKKQKLVQIIEEDGNTMVKITDEGRVRALRYKLSEMMVKNPKVWDKKWRVVIFDIQEKHKRMREIFRKHLQIMGFYMLQKSVWVHPYPCFNEIEFLRQIYDVGIDVTYLVAEKIENPQDLKDQFNLH